VGTSCVMYNVPMATNERLRAALLKAGLGVDELAAAAHVDPKTCQRWVTKGRTPHRVNAKRAAIALREDMSYLWPEVERGRQRRDMHPDFVALYASRADSPQELWRALFQQAEREIGILVYAAVFLHELWTDFNRMLLARAESGCRCGFCSVTLTAPPSAGAGRKRSTGTVSSRGVGNRSSTTRR
jgi:hypothetical protein